jgi:hypothetical protein
MQGSSPSFRIPLRACSAADIARKTLEVVRCQRSLVQDDMPNDHDDVKYGHDSIASEPSTDSSAASKRESSCDSDATVAEDGLRVVRHYTEGRFNRSKDTAATSDSNVSERE